MEDVRVDVQLRPCLVRRSATCASLKPSTLSTWKLARTSSAERAKASSMVGGGRSAERRRAHETKTRRRLDLGSRRHRQVPGLRQGDEGREPQHKARQ